MEGGGTAGASPHSPKKRRLEWLFGAIGSPVTLLVLVAGDKAPGAEVLDGRLAFGEDVAVVGVDLDGTMTLIPFDAEVLGPHPGVWHAYGICLFGRAGGLASPGSASLETTSTTVELLLEGGYLDLFKGGLEMCVNDGPVVPRKPHVFKASEEFGGDFKNLRPR